MLIIMAIVCGLLSMVTYGLANVYSQPLAKKLGAAQMLFLRGIVISLILALGAHPHFAEYAEAIGEHAKDISKIRDAVLLLFPAPTQLEQMQLEWSETPSIQCARLPRGRVAVRSVTSGKIMDMSPGAWVNFIGGAANGEFDNVSDAA